MRFLFGVLLSAALLWAQKPEYDFYPEFRNSFVPRIRAERPGISEDEILKRYAASLKDVPKQERERRLALLRSSRPALEIDYWNRFYANPESKFNRAPNQFLVEVVKDLKPGAALDYGMGEGRNALFLARAGWQVWGFDPADAAIATAEKRAKEAGLTVNAKAVRDSEYDFGKERFDLILFSWTMPLVPVERVIDALKPGGVVVMECERDFVGRNGMLKMFDDLRILRYEIVRATADFYDRRESDVLRMVAKKE